jgi:SAM-dependent methyltransferase
MTPIGRYNLLELRHIDEDKQLRVAYEARYMSEPIQHLDSFYRWVLRVVAPQPDRRLLDVACGQGILPNLAAAYGVRAYGCDLSAYALKSKHNPQVSLIVADGEHLPYADGVFDYITNIGSLEHYINPCNGVREMARLLKPGGQAFILLPNTFGFGNFLYAWRHGRTLDDGQPIQRYAARYEWQALLEDNGLCVVNTLAYERVWPTSLKDVIWYLSNPKALVLLLISLFLPFNLASCFMYICERRKSE